jgi:hypothetical protein
MSHYPDERAAEQATASTEQQPESGSDTPVSKLWTVPPTVFWQYLFGFFLVFIDWRLALVFWLVATSNHLLSGLLFRLIEAVEHGNSVRGR